MPQTWIFQGKPEIWDVVAGVNRLPKINWGVRQYKDEIKVGDSVYIWVSGRNAGIVALARVTSSPDFYTDSAEEKALYPGGPPRKFQGKQLRVYLDIDRILRRRIARLELVNHPILGDLSILKMPQATNFRVSAQQAHQLDLIAKER
jgi:predicted RNA-binding protein with PUA-like domain